MAECQIPKDLFERQVAETFKEASKKTNEKVGDGTTLTSILGGHLFNRIYKLLSEQDSAIGIGGRSSVGVITLKKKILASAKEIKDKILSSAKEIRSLEELERIAIISVEDTVLGKTIAKMAWEVGVDGFLDVVEGYKGEIETEIIKGKRFAAKVPAKGFINNKARFEMVAKDCPVLITNYALDNPAQLGKVINPFLAKNPKLIIISPSFSQSVLTDLWLAMYTTTPDGQRVKGPLDIFPVHTPSLRTEEFEDLAIYCGARFIDKATGSKLQNAGENCLDFLEKLVVKDSEVREDAMAIGGAGATGINKAIIKDDMIGLETGEEGVVAKKTPVQERIEILKGQLKETKEDKFKKLLERRIASMASAVGIIRVGDSTNASSLYRKLKVEDAVYACKAALRAGYVKGGGLCLKEIAEDLPEEDILRETLLAPYNQIQDSVDGGLEIGEDIIDPAEAIFFALEHATQVVANLATVDIITVESEDGDPNEGTLEMAKWIREYVVTQKIKEGQIKESEAESYRDSMGGLTVDEQITLDRG